MTTKTTELMANKATGGKGYYLPENTEYAVVNRSEKFTPVYNIDMMGNAGTFSTLETTDGDVLDDMNLTAQEVNGFVRNFTTNKPFTKIKCNVDVWLNRFVYGE